MLLLIALVQQVLCIQTALQPGIRSISSTVASEDNSTFLIIGISVVSTAALVLLIVMCMPPKRKQPRGFFDGWL